MLARAEHRHTGIQCFAAGEAITMFRFHLFVCTQPKPEGVPSCAAAGSLAVLERFQREIERQGLENEVQISSSGCFGLCEEGPILVIYPEGVWYRHVRAEDVSEIVDSHLRASRSVARLVWEDAEARQAMSLEHAARYRSAMAARDKAGVLPEHLNQAIRGYMPSRVILTALELDLFTAVGDGVTAEKAAAILGVDTRGVEMLLHALVALGLLTKSENAFRNTADSARYFTGASKDNHRDGLLHVANIWHRWSTLTEAVQLGTRVPIERSSSPRWTENFIAAMQRNAKDRAPQVLKAVGTTGVRRILDLGGGSGIYSITFSKASPEIHCEIVDLPEVVPLTAGYIERAGVSSQVTIRAGDMLENDLGSGFDLVLLNAICHMFSPEQNQRLFRRACQALAPGGRLVVQDFLLNRDKTGPLNAALFSLNMLVGTDSGACYSDSEYTSWMITSGFKEAQRIRLAGPSDLIIGLAP
jgi:(2Fe-2S) ferredoxin/SAM-dependent methyltransferase